MRYMTTDCITRPFSIQQGATCWFNSIMNGFVTSKYGQAIMYYAVARYLDSRVLSRRELQDFMTDELTYPPSGRLTSKFNFYKWFYRWLIIGVLPQRNSRNVLRNISLSKRSSNNERHSSPVIGLFEILERMDIDSFAVFDFNAGTEIKAHPDPDFIVVAPTSLRTNNPMDRLTMQTFQYHGHEYILDHASLGVFFGGGGQHGSHAITGIRCAFNPNHLRIIDSNSPESYQCDWTSLPNIQSSREYVTFCQKTYNGPPQTPIYLFIIYVKRSINVSNANSDLYNIRPQKLMNRFSTAMNVD